MEYPIVFPSGERRIRLQGEAYFQVASDKSSPFIIEMGKVQVQVCLLYTSEMKYEKVLIVIISMRPVWDIIRRQDLSSR